MKKTFLTLVLLLTVSGMHAQKYFTKTGSTDFRASVAAFEPVEATNKSTTAVLNSSNGQIAALVFLKAFHFKVALMQEHFNENYMDSDKYPKATFKGSLVDFSIDKLSSKDKEFKLIGVLMVRGKQKKVSTLAKLKKEDGKIYLSSSFMLKPQEFDIKIPGIVREKIAKEINVLINYELNEKK